MDSWWVPYVPKSCRPDFNQEVTRVVAPYWPTRVHLSSTRIMKDTSNGRYICSCLIPMVSWWVPYLPKGCRPDFNNGLGGDSNSGPVLGPRRLFESYSNNAPPWATPILCQMPPSAPEPGHIDLVGSVNTIRLRPYGWNTSKVDVVGSVNTIRLDVVASVNTIRLRRYGWFQFNRTGS